MNRRVDLNGDVGEGYPNDVPLFSLVTSANVACGAHAGDDRTMRQTVRAAAARGVAVGAHPSFPDREHFGRRVLSRAPELVYVDVVEQVRTLAAIAVEEGVALTHVKPHGALYNAAARDAVLADAIARAVRDVDSQLILVGLFGGALLRSGRNAGLRVAGEGFADRRYEADGSLVSRDRPDAFVHDAEEALEQVLRLVDAGVETICVHGDNPDALAFAQQLSEGLRSNGCAIDRIT